MHATSSVTVDLASNTSPTAESRVTTTDDSSCGYSQLGPSASVVDAESELGRIKALLDRIVKAEVSEWLNKVVEDVVANACHRRQAKEVILQTQGESTLNGCHAEHRERGRQSDQQNGRSTEVASCNWDKSARTDAGEVAGTVCQAKTRSKKSSLSSRERD